MKKNFTVNLPIKSFKYLPYFITIYSFSFMLPDFLLKKFINIPHLGLIPLDVFFTGIYFVLLDIVTEVYGFYEARKMMFAGLIAYVFFILAMEFGVNIGTTQTKFNDSLNFDAHKYLFEHIYVVGISVIICTLISNMFNIFILSKWKILVKGKYFWFRSIVTSFTSAIIFSFLSNIVAVGVLISTTDKSYILKVMLISLFLKLITLIVFAYPTNKLCQYLKKIENTSNLQY